MTRRKEDAIIESNWHEPKLAKNLRIDTERKNDFSCTCTFLPALCMNHINGMDEVSYGSRNLSQFGSFSK